jgi:hypothetical protein
MVPALTVYVDIIVTRNYHEEIRSLKNYLANQFEKKTWAV